jgi:hypothetical protein
MNNTAIHSKIQSGIVSAHGEVRFLVNDSVGIGSSSRRARPILQFDAQVDALNRITVMQARPYLIEDETTLIGVAPAAMYLYTLRPIRQKKQYSGNRAHNADQIDFIRLIIGGQHRRIYSTRCFVKDT